jgi:hypothetical protein
MNVRHSAATTSSAPDICENPKMSEEVLAGSSTPGGDVSGPPDGICRLGMKY